MIKTLLAGTVLSTGLFAGGVLDTEDVKSNQKIEKSKYSETIEMPEGTDSNQMKTGKAQAAYKNEDGTFTVKEIDESEIPTDGVKAEQGERPEKPMKATRHADGTFTIQEMDENEIPADGVPAGELPTKEGNELPEGAEPVTPIEEMESGEAIEGEKLDTSKSIVLKKNEDGSMLIKQLDPSEIEEGDIEGDTQPATPEK
ncbi:hypothetical protein [Bacillus wiedmannii]|uniref:hypothetical protein n=1 Tax=Bacillus wiedmannii TaxID=1890302 RepID=UPI000BF150C5|nr:hypothetical protein [Bacillus wiedmannii]PEO39954.1 hypothetical protein CN555_06320 [Bacillus wiedmannii]